MLFADKLSDNCALLLITVGNDLCVVPQKNDLIYFKIKIILGMSFCNIYTFLCL